MPDHLEPMELRGFLTVGESRTMGDMTVLLTATASPHKFFIRINGPPERLASRVKRHRVKLVDKLPPLE